jgi:hypothetical protein
MTLANALAWASERDPHVEWRRLDKVSADKE